jgi:GT2 family glycosyltransferase
MARADVIVPVLNNDVTLERNYLDCQVVALQEKGVGVVGGKVYRPGTAVFNAAGNRVDWNHGWTDAFGRGELDVGQFDSPREVDYVEFPTVRRDVNDKIGEIDEKYLHYYLDVDLCVSAKEAGYRVMYVPGAIAWHHEAGTVGTHRVRHFYATQRDSLRFLLKHAPASEIIFRFLRCTLFRLLDLAGMILEKRIDFAIVQCKAYVWNILNLRATRRSRRLY